MHIEDIVKNMVKDFFNFEENYSKYPSSAKALFLKKMLDSFSIPLNESIKEDFFYNINVINSIVSYLYEDTVKEFLKLENNNTNFNIKGTSAHSLSLLPLSFSGNGFRIAVDYHSNEFEYLSQIKIVHQNTLLNESLFNSPEFQIFFKEINENFKPFNILTKEKIVNGNVADLALLMSNLSYVYTLKEKFDINPIKKHNITNKNILFYYYEILKNDTESYIYNKEDGFSKLYNHLSSVFDYFDEYYDTNTFLVGEMMGYEEFVCEGPLNFEEYFTTLKTIALYTDKVNSKNDVSLWKTDLAPFWFSAMERIENISLKNFEDLKLIFKIIDKKGFDFDKEELRKKFSKIENNILSAMLDEKNIAIKNMKRL